MPEQPWNQTQRANRRYSSCPSNVPTTIVFSARNYVVNTRLRSLSLYAKCASRALPRYIGHTVVDIPNRSAVGQRERGNAHATFHSPPLLPTSIHARVANHLRASPFPPKPRCTLCTSFLFAPIGPSTLSCLTVRTHARMHARTEPHTTLSSLSLLHAPTSTCSQIPNLIPILDHVPISIPVPLSVHPRPLRPPFPVHNPTSLKSLIVALSVIGNAINPLR